MDGEVKGRRYVSPKRADQALGTRGRILDAAWDLFTAKGYAATSIADVAKAAGVAVDTIYATIGRKPVLLREVVEAAISGAGRPVDPLERGYVQQIRTRARAAEMLDLYASAIAEMSPRTAPIFAALRDAAGTDADCAALDREISTRRADNMLRMTTDLRATGDLREDLSDRRIADTIWATAGWQHYLQLTAERGWPVEAFRDHLADTWSRSFLRTP
ncbi:TetR/AcrR family transcriptional regulator [Amnibacterium sp.]|uniref:TetR/AcrR family transcriptional regulator n=1 Tax=Amnibacterium sp. TaxID=1872496 RepID=UPI00261A5754|nr:TetR family transcriptional regulator [Amnibacterium sp.]